MRTPCLHVGPPTSTGTRATVDAMASWFFLNQPCMLFVDGEVGTLKDCNVQLSQYQGVCNSDIGGEIFIFELCVGWTRQYSFRLCFT